MKSLFFYILFFFIAFCTEGILAHFPSTLIRIDLVWLLALFVGFRVSFLPGCLVISLFALSQECLAAPLHGVFLFSYLVVYSFLRMSRNHIFLQERSSQIIWVFLLTVTQKSIEAGFLYWQGYRTLPFFAFILPHSLLNAFAVMAVFPLLDKISLFSERTQDFYGR